MALSKTTLLTTTLLLSTLASSISYAGAPAPVVVQAFSPPVSMKAFPNPRAGDSRLVVRLPQRPNEANLLVRVTPGRYEQVDCNARSYVGKFETKIAEGWGYPFYVVSNVSGGAATLMACSPSMPKRTAFVPVVSAQQTVGYNSRAPMVYYVPKGFIVQYEVFALQQQGQAKPE
jgi:ecotin